ncbi:MAG: hypothetical protein ABI597_09345 [Gammaproteobacteria bacterium]
MKSTQKLIELDKRFNPAFFVSQQEEKTISEEKLSFPIPVPKDQTKKREEKEELRDLQKFLASSDGKKYKWGMRKILDDITIWALKNELFDAKEELDHFYHIFFEISPGGAINLPLLQQSPRLLSELLTRLQDAKIPVIKKKEVMGNLLPLLSRCGPGVLTYIGDACISLSSDKLTEVRRDMAVQTVLGQLIRIKKEFPGEIAEGMEVHYVNAVLIHYTKQLGLPAIEDGYIGHCNKDIVDLLIEAFPAAIRKNLTVEAIFDYILAKYDLTRLKTSPDFDILEQALNEYGRDSEYSLTQVCVPGAGYQAKDTAEYAILFSLMQRLANKIDFHHDIETNKLNPANIVWSKNSHIRFSYVIVMSADNERQTKSLIAYFADMMLGEESERTQFVKSFLPHLNDKQKAELSEELLKLFHRKTKKLTVNSAEYTAWLGKILNLFKTEGIKEFFKTHAEIKDLIMLARDFPAETRFEIFSALGLELKTLPFKNVNDVSAFLQLYSSQERFNLLASKDGVLSLTIFSAPAENIAVDKSEQKEQPKIQPLDYEKVGMFANHMLAALTTELKELKNDGDRQVWTENLYKLFETPSAKEIFQHTELPFLLLDLVRELPIDKRFAVFQKLGFGSPNFSAGNMDFIIPWLHLFSPVKQRELLLDMTSKAPLVDISIGEDIGALLRYLPYDYQTPKEYGDFLTRLLGPKVKEIFTQEHGLSHLYDLLRSLSKEKYESFLQFLGRETLSKIPGDNIPLLTILQNLESDDPVKMKVNTLAPAIDFLSRDHYQAISCQQSAIYFRRHRSELRAMDISDASQVKKITLNARIMDVVSIPEKNQFAVLTRDQTGEQAIVFYNQHLQKTADRIVLPNSKSSYHLVVRENGSYIAYDDHHLFLYHAENKKWDEQQIKLGFEKTGKFESVTSLANNQILIIKNESEESLLQQSIAVFDAQFKVTKELYDYSFGTEPLSSPNGKYLAFMQLVYSTTDDSYIPSADYHFLTCAMVDAYKDQGPSFKTSILLINLPKAVRPLEYVGKLPIWEADGNVIFLSQEGVMRFNPTDGKAPVNIFACDTERVSCLTPMQDGPLTFFYAGLLVSLSPTKQAPLLQAEEKTVASSADFKGFSSVSEDVKNKAERLYSVTMQKLKTVEFEVANYNIARLSPSFEQKEGSQKEYTKVNKELAKRTQQLFLLQRLNDELVKKKGDKSFTECIDLIKKKEFPHLLTKKSGGYFSESNPFFELCSAIEKADLVNVKRPPSPTPWR